MARVAGITKQTFSGYLNSGRLPGVDVLGKWIEEFGLDANWLLTGRGNMLLASAQESLPGKGDALSPSWKEKEKEETACHAHSGFWVKATQINQPLSLHSLAGCDEAGWCGEPSRVAAISPPVLGPDWLALLVSGDTLLPHGIRKGYVVFCDPAQPPVAEEAVFVQRTDGRSSLKIFAGQRADGWLELQNWTPPDTEGRQAVLTERLAPGEIQCLAPVLLVRQRL